MKDKEFEVELCNGCQHLNFRWGTCQKNKESKSLNSITHEDGFIAYIKPRLCEEPNTPTEEKE